jgi:hypothetical protein
VDWNILSGSPTSISAIVLPAPVSAELSPYAARICVAE